MDITHIQAQVICIVLLLVLYKFNLQFEQQDNFRYLKKVYFFAISACVFEIFKRVCFDNDSVIYTFNVLHYLCVCFCALIIVFAYANKRCTYKKKEKACIALITVLTSVLTVLQLVFLPQGFSVAPYFVFVILFVVFAKSQHTRIIVDNLTQLKNRYGMDEEIREQLEQYAKDKNNSFFVIACDMNDFKSINDTWGHNEGDRALRLVGAALDKVCSDFDAEAFRVGGDEFIIITDTSEPNLASEVCLAVKTEMGKINFRDDFKIEISMGVALYDGTKTISELIENADSKLYLDKEKSKK